MIEDRGGRGKKRLCKKKWERRGGLLFARPHLPFRINDDLEREKEEKIATLRASKAHFLLASMRYIS